MMITLRHIYYFISSYEAKSYTKASEQLYVSRQTISSTVKEMEEELKNEVFVKGSSPLKLTACGEFLYENGRNLLQKFDTMVYEASFVRNKKFAISISSEILAIVPKLKKGILSYFHYEPDILVDLIESNSMDEAFEMIKSGVVSSGFLFSTNTNYQGYWNMCIEKYPVYAVVSQEHPLHACESLDIENILDFPCICFGTPKLFYPQLEEYRKQNNKQRKYIVEPQVIRASQYMTRDPQAIMLSLVDRDINTDYPHLKTIPINGLEYQLQLVGRLDKEEYQLCKSFGDFIASHFK